MNKADLITHLADKTGLAKKQVEDLVEAFTETVVAELKKGGEIVLAGFGTFLAKQRAARMGVNPQNPTQKMHIPAVVVPKFKAGANFKKALKG